MCAGVPTSLQFFFLTSSHSPRCLGCPGKCTIGGVHDCPMNYCVGLGFQLGGQALGDNM